MNTPAEHLEELAKIREERKRAQFDRDYVDELLEKTK